MPISTSKESHPSFSFRLQEALAKLVQQKDIAIPDRLEADGSLKVALRDPRVLHGKTDIFVVRQGKESAEIVDLPDAPVLALIYKVYGKENVAFEGNNLRIKSTHMDEAAAEKQGGSYPMALYYTEFHNARVAAQGRTR